MNSDIANMNLDELVVDSGPLLTDADFARLISNTSANLGILQANHDTLSRWLINHAPAGSTVRSDGNVSLSIDNSGTIKLSKVSEEDYTQPKPAIQIPLATFQAYTDQFLRPLTPADLQWLTDQNDLITPFANVKLGSHYLDQWINDSGPLPQQSSYYGQFTERVLSALLSEQIDVPQTDEIDEMDIQQQQDRNLLFDDMTSLEERIKLELKYIGVLDEQIDDDDLQNDEISIELKKAQDQLRNVTADNYARRSRIAQISKKWYARQEYMQLLDETDKAIEMAYTRRFKNLKKQKKRQFSSKPVAPFIMSLIEKRRRLINEVGIFFTEKAFEEGEDLLE